MALLSVDLVFEIDVLVLFLFFECLREEFKSLDLNFAWYFQLFAAFCLEAVHDCLFLHQNVVGNFVFVSLSLYLVVQSGN